METTITQELNDTCLYMHTRKSDGRIFYIGIGSKRRSKSARGRNKHWYNIVKKHGYDITILVDGLTWSRAAELEVKMISFYGRKDLKLGCLVNLTHGGDGTPGRIVSDEEKAKISERTKGENNGMFGAYGDKNPMFGRVGELHPAFGLVRPDHSINMSGKNNPMSEKSVYDVWLEKYGKEEADIRHEIWTEKKRIKSLGNKGGSRKVKCTKTNVIYDNVKTAAESIGMKPGTLYNKLAGYNKTNETTLVFLDEQTKRWSKKVLAESNKVVSL